MASPKPAGELNPVSLEEALMMTWKREQTFQQSIQMRHDGAPFIFLEGPPTANGLPGIHHVAARTYKDLVCRWKAMEGHFVERKGGWDTHGLPVEIEVQKRLDLLSNEAILEFGMKEFNDECKKSVWTYEDAWRKMTERMAFWVDLDDPYITLHNEYIESGWWALKQMFDKGLLYKGHKVLPFCPQTGTSYSTHEVALGYKEVEEPSVYLKFKLVDDDAAVLAWTTTPWTLPGNVGLAVGPEVTYARIRIVAEPEGWDGRGGAAIGEELILAEDLLAETLRHQIEIIDTFPGSELVGKAYHPLFPDAVERLEVIRVSPPVAGPLEVRVAEAEERVHLTHQLAHQPLPWHDNPVSVVSVFEAYDWVLGKSPFEDHRGPRSYEIAVIVIPMLDDAEQPV